MGHTVTFDLSAAELKEILRPAKAGLFGVKAKLMDKVAESQVGRQLLGPTTLELSEEGLLIAKAGSEERVSWSEVRHVNENPRAWMIQRIPSGLAIVPLAAVPTDERAALTEQLRVWLGAKYKVRQGGQAG